MSMGGDGEHGFGEELRIKERFATEWVPIVNMACVEKGSNDGTVSTS